MNQNRVSSFTIDICFVINLYNLYKNYRKHAKNGRSRVARENIKYI